MHRTALHNPVAKDCPTRTTDISSALPSVPEHLDSSDLPVEVAVSALLYAVIEFDGALPVPEQTTQRG